MRRTCGSLLVILLLAGALGTVTLAQRGGGFRGFGRDLTYGHRNPEYDGRYTFTRVRFTGSNAWNHDYPQADRYLPLILNEVTSLRPNLDASNVLDLEDPEIYRNPILYVWEPGGWRISQLAAENLRSYMLKGGFVIFDDFEANQWNGFEASFRAALPDAVFFELDLTHPIYHSFFDLDDLDLPHPSVNVTPGYYAVYEDNDPAKRMMALVNHNADIAEYWEWSDRGAFPLDLTNDAFKIGVNYIVYALTH